MRTIIATPVLLAAFAASFWVTNSGLKVLDRGSRDEPVEKSRVITTNEDVLSVDTVNIVSTQVESAELTNVTESPTPTIEPTSTPTPTAIVTSTPTVTPTLSPTPIPQVSFTDEEIMGFVERFAGQYALDPNVLRHIAQCESGFNQHATNGPYVGLFQFGTSAWVTGRAKMGEDANLDLRLNAEESIQTAAFLLAEGREELWPNCIP